MKDKPHSQWSVEELADLPKFRKWVKSPTKEQDEFWEKQAIKSPEFQEKIKEAKQLVQLIQKSKELTDSIAPDPAFANKLTNLVGLEKQGQNPKLTLRPNVQRRWAIAATIAMLLSAGLWFFSNQNSTPNWLVYETDFGEWEKATLPDGSLVHLNAHSTLKMKNDWSEGTTRTVWLEGEAFFEVEKKLQTKAKFQVLTEGLTIEVLGTRFNVATTKETTDVFLEEGKITLQTKNQKTEMQPNDFAHFTKNTAQLRVEKQIQEKSITSWKSGVLMLRAQKVGDILERLETIYGCEFKVTNAAILASVKTIAVPMDKLEIVLPILEKTLGTTIDQQGNQLIIQ